MFGNINKQEKNYSSRLDPSEYSSVSRNRNNKIVKHNERLTTKSRNYDEATYSISSEEESEESQKSVKKSIAKKSKFDESEVLKKENMELKMVNDMLMKINNVSESVIKNSMLMINITNEQKLLNSRLERLENESRNKSINNQSKKELKNDEDILPIGDDSSVDISTVSNLNTTKSPVKDNLVNNPILLPKMI